MKIRFHTRIALALAIACAAPLAARGQSAGTLVDVGPGSAGASGTASGAWQLVESNSRVSNGTSVGKALAVGAGPHGLAISHSVGVNSGGVGAAHNFNLSIGPQGAHVSNGGVVSQGGNSRVIAGGNAQTGFTGPRGGSQVSGFGNHTRAHSQSRTMPAFRTLGSPRFPAPGGMFFRSR